MTAYEPTDAIDALIRHRLLWNESEDSEEARLHENSIEILKKAITEGLKNLKSSGKP